MSVEPTQQPGGHGGDDEPSLGFDFVAPPPKPGAAAYRVLARKYRPSSFDDLIGQDAMVRTLGNAFRLNRIHQAYMLTGVRGIGKTTTARILARAFNYEVPAKDGQPAITRPTINMPELGVHCQAIIDSQHIDVIEMDAASHTGVDKMRDIIENVQFRPVMARIKVYIIDEVHMLSKAAFNALLKTLEEPPEHVKFVFATTEIEKVPVTVRSRCQRFDLRRIAPDLMIAHLAGICEKEKVAVDSEALALVARAAEGSVRDALSLLDQAIAMGASAGEEKIGVGILREMLGSADRACVIDLFEAVMKGDIASALDILKDQSDKGADPAQILAGMAEFVHLVTRIKVAPNMRADASMSPDEFSRGSEFAKTLGLPALTRAWQLLLKGHAELKDSAHPLAAADMVLVRLAYAADLPSPEDVLRRLQNAPASDGGATARTAPSGDNAPRGMASSGAGSGGAQAMLRQPGARQAAGQPQAASPPQAADAAPRVKLTRFEDVVTLAQVHRDIQLKTALERDVRLVRFAEGTIDFSLVPGASPQVAQTLMRRLQDWTGVRWNVVLSRDEGAPTLREQAQSRDDERMTGVRAQPLVRSVLEHFPGAQIVSVRSADAEPPPTAATITPETLDPGGDEISYADDSYTEDDL